MTLDEVWADIRATKTCETCGKPWKDCRCTGCGCCGVILGTNKGEWCNRCRKHIRPLLHNQFRAPWERTWLAQHDEVCPFAETVTP